MVTDRNITSLRWRPCGVSDPEKMQDQLVFVFDVEQLVGTPILIDLTSNCCVWINIHICLTSPVSLSIAGYKLWAQSLKPELLFDSPKKKSVIPFIGALGWRRGGRCQRRAVRCGQEGLS